MPKLKTNRSAKKRIRVTKSGRFKHFKAGKSHLLTSKRAKRKRLLGKAGYIDGGERHSLAKMLPFGA